MNIVEVNKMNISERIEKLYRNFFNDVKYYVIKNNGTLDDAKDLFQEVCVSYIKILEHPDGKNILDERSYLLGMARNMWIKQLQKNKNNVEFNPAIHQPDDENDTGRQKQSKVMDLVLQKLKEISDDCRSIIFESFYMKKPNAELARMFGYSEQFVKVKKHRCLQGLKRLVQESGDYKLIQLEW